MTHAGKRVPLVFFRTDTGTEPAREWLLEPPPADCRLIGFGLKELEFGRPMGMPFRLARVIVCVHEQELYALHGFTKKTRKTRVRGRRLGTTK